MDNSNEILKLTNLEIGYASRSLVKDINLSVGVGRFILLLGANGKGKSTLLKTIAGQIKSIGGEIEIQGNNLNNSNLKEIARSISFLPGNVVLPNEVSVLDLLNFARIPYLKGISGLSQKDHVVIDQVVKEIEIKDLIDKFYMSLSDGQKQLVNIARSLVQETPIIVLDEPTAHLDLVNKRKIFQVLKEQTSNGKLVLCCSHDLLEGVKNADQIWIINKDGRFELAEKLSVEEIENKLF